MNRALTEQPHFIPGYTGHCPQLRHRPGMTYGHQTHKLLLDPCCPHSADLIVTIPESNPTCKDRPSPGEIRFMKKREPTVEPAYRHPIIPGYDGHVPSFSKTFGLRYTAAATEAIVGHELLMKLYRCERHSLVHRGLLESNQGIFRSKLNEIMLPVPARYRGPLHPVQPRGQMVLPDSCKYREPKQPYSKHMVPHFLSKNDEEKYIKIDYNGHIPKYRFRYGETHQAGTHSALNKFSDSLCKNRRDKWCPRDGISEYRTSDCPNTGRFKIYHSQHSLLPNYGGHVPGANYLCGATFSNASKLARRWLEIHRPKNYRQECHNIPAP